MSRSGVSTLSLVTVLAACSGPSTAVETTPVETSAMTSTERPVEDVAATNGTASRGETGREVIADAGVTPVDDGPRIAPQGPLALAAMRGPYASLEAYCASFVAAHRRVGADPSCQPSTSGVEGRSVAPAGAPPFVEARVFRASNGEGLTSCMLAARTARGWFIDEAHQPACDTEGATRIGVEVEEIAVRDVRPGGAPLVVFRYTSRTALRSEAQDETERSSDKTLVLCGVGASERPTCIRVPLGSVRETDRNGRTRRRTWQLRVSYPDDTTIVVFGRGADGSARGAIGRHRVVFP